LSRGAGRGRAKARVDPRDPDWRPPKSKKPVPANTFYFEARCPACQRWYWGNYPLWVRIAPFPCICGEMVPTPRAQPGYFEDWDRI
jgi:hypothetical protein